MVKLLHHASPSSGGVSHTQPSPPNSSIGRAYRATLSIAARAGKLVSSKLALLALAAVVVVGSVGSGSVYATEPPAAVQEFGVEFDEIINAVIVRMTEYITPLILLALGLVAVGIFVGWLRSASHAR